MGLAFRQMFTTIAVFFGALEKLSKAADHLATWAEESAGQFGDEARIQRKQRRIAMEAEAAKQITDAERTVDAA